MGELGLAVDSLGAELRLPRSRSARRITSGIQR